MMFAATLLMAQTAIAGDAKQRPPSAQDIAGALEWQEGAACRSLIDACVDDKGNDIYPPVSFSVSRQNCQPQIDHSMRCSFSSIRTSGERSESSRNCDGVLISHANSYGDPIWLFAVPDPRRRPWGALLSCN